METFANLILNNAQTISDGGMIGSILRYVKLFNNSNIKHDVMPYISSARLTGGYFAGLFFGILWILGLISLMVFLFYLYCKRSKLNSNRILKTKYYISSDKKNGYPFVYYFQMFAIVIFLIPTTLLLCFCMKNVSEIHYSISKTAVNYDTNNTESPEAMLPALKKSLFHLKDYLSTFAVNARENTIPIVDEIIQATKDMQKETMKGFNAKLMRKLGVANTFKYGADMTNIVVNFFDVSNSLLQNQTEYYATIDEMFPRQMNPNFGIFNFILDIKQSFNSLEICDENCKEFQSYFSQSFTEVEGFPDTSFATSFLFVMKQQNKTRQSVIAQTQHGRKEMAKTMAKTQEKMKVLLDIDGTIRNMTGETWDKMEHQFKGAIKLIDKMILAIDKEKTTNKVSHYSRLLMTILMIPVIFAIVVLIITLIVIVNFFCFPTKPFHPLLRYSAYLCLLLVVFIILFSTVTFLYGGKMETEVCRYLRTGQPLIDTESGTKLVLDTYINKFLSKVLPKIAASMPKSDFPFPKPKNILYGLIHRCRKNEPILAAIDAIDSLDTKALSKPEVAAKFIAVGRRLLIESLNETDPNKMLPPDMRESLQQASQLGMFKKIDIKASINQISRTPLFVMDNKNIKHQMPLKIFLDRIDKYFELYVPKIKDVNIINKLKTDHTQLLKLIEKYNLVTDRLRFIFAGMKDIPPIKPVVENLRNSLDSMLLILNNKTKLFSIGNEYFDQIIVKTTPQKAAGIMAKFGPKMMSKLGYCGTIFKAYQSSIDTICDIVIVKLNVYWIYLGSVGLLLTCFLSIVYLMMLRTLQNVHHSNDIELTKNENKSVSKPLVDNSENDIKEKSVA